jgi:hypothetical protein
MSAPEQPETTGQPPASHRITRIHIDLPHAGIVPVAADRFEATEFAERRTGWKGR